MYPAPPELVTYLVRETSDTKVWLAQNSVAMATELKTETDSEDSPEIVTFRNIFKKFSAMNMRT